MTQALHSMIADTQPDLMAIKLDADNETINGSGVDMLGYEGVIFMASAQGGEAGSYTLKAQQDTASNYGTAADLLGSAVAFTTTTGANGFAFLEIRNPLERYVRPVLVVPNVTTPTAICVVAVRYGKDRRPETNTDGEMHDHPAEGTA